MSRRALARAISTNRGTGSCLLAVTLAFFLSGCVGATGSGSNLTATPSSVDFGDVNTGDSISRSVTIANASAADVSIGNISITGAGFSASGLSSGLTLGPGDTANLSVTFSPSSAGKVNGAIAIAQQAFPIPLKVTVSGNGVDSGAHSVTLTWNASTSTVAGYRAYRATSPGGPYQSLNSAPTPQLRYTDSTVQSGATYYYVVTAVGSDSAESAYSNQASAAIPKP
jgi:hypothetical protein